MKRSVLALAAVVAAVLAFAIPAGAATVQTVYNSSTQPLQGNFPSAGAEASNFSEFGDGVTLAGDARQLMTVVVTMSSWACQSGAWNTNDCASANQATFMQPVTLNVYAAPVGSGPVLPGPILGTVTDTFAIPYRPSANVQHCNATTPAEQGGPALGKWYDKKTGDCFNGKATNITFNFKSQHISLVNNPTLVYGISYNTTHDGPSPIGESAPCFTASGGCPYDSLNIALNDSASVGSQLNPGTVFQNAGARNDYCDNTPTVGVFNLDSPTNACWTGDVPAVKITGR